LRARLGSPGTAAGILLATALWAGCSTVAAVLLDLPEPQPASEHATETASSRVPVATEREPLPIELLTDPDSILELLPRDEAGGVDWVAAIRNGTIDPKWTASADSIVAKQEGFAFDISLKGPNPMFDAAFPHSVHVAWVACPSCHGEIFPYKGDPITMGAVNAGEACGRCHGRVAFAVSTCVRCHRGMPAYQAITDPLGQDVVLARKGAGGDVETAFPQARFPHWRHRIRYRCTACHPSLFSMRAGTDTLTMVAMRNGVACGTCHNGSVAFGLVDCTRCHTAPVEAPTDGP